MGEKGQPTGSTASQDVGVSGPGAPNASVVGASAPSASVVGTSAPNASVAGTSANPASVGAAVSSLGANVTGPVGAAGGEKGQSTGDLLDSEGLQGAVNRHTKFQETASNVLKKQSDAEGGVATNMK